ncbi:PEP-CTERM sorting domain-containing protein [Sandaracinobacteroides saxicola]|uniref:PEP-CTERM sorting domain-containing protein n=1 Tax=Sandaracinobacteroides saxicola TaxID=2759707 RepID=A0A7G5IMY8_9SPHN|nr:PEP-CTERM sorting domain-containing protein [Sandaracinobacteroides saxicola]
MNPYICSRTPAIVTSKDLTVMDAIGWNLTDEAQNANYVLPTSALAYVPEPATWAMMIVGFGLVGSTMRRRRPAVSA